MDYLRYAYWARCQFGTDPHVTSDVRWYRCAPTAVPLGFPCAFGSEVWETHQPHEGLGERYHPPSNWLRNRTPVILPGTHEPCGSLAVFEAGWPGPAPIGLPRDVYGFATCCGLTVDFVGGLALAGDGELYILIPLRGGSGCGGLADGFGLLTDRAGAGLGGPANPPYPIRMLETPGGTDLGGYSDLWGPLEAKGGLDLGGHGETLGVIPAKVGAAFGGLADNWTSLHPAGGPALGGAYDRFRTIEKAGGVGLGGKSNPPFPIRTIEQAAGLGLGGLQDHGFWINPAIVGAACNQLNSPPSPNLTGFGSGALVVLMTAAWWGNGTAITCSAPSGFTLAHALTPNVDVNIWVFWQWTASALGVVTPTWGGGSGSSKGYGWGAINVTGAPNPVVDVQNARSYNGTAPSISFPAQLGFKEVLFVCAAAVGGIENFTGTWGSGFSTLGISGGGPFNIGYKISTTKTAVTPAQTLNISSDVVLLATSWRFNN